MNVISESDPVYAIELPPHKLPTQESGAFILITWVNVVLAEPDNIRYVDGETLKVVTSSSVKVMEYGQKCV